MNFFRRRRIKKEVAALLAHARHIRNLWEDIADADSLSRLKDAEEKTRASLRSKDLESTVSSAKHLEKAISTVAPHRSYQGLRDNIEMIVVAVAVAMAFRSYFVQPFKIPTSSMYPTLYGITYKTDAGKSGKPPFFPLALLKWTLFGEWHVTVKAGASGIVNFQAGPQKDLTVFINDLPHVVSEGMSLLVAPGDRVFKGQILASGIRKAGDHILVNKIAWNFRRPIRGEIMVFKTDGITHPQIKQNEYYVKRLVGLPDERLAIADPKLKINGATAHGNKMIERIQSQESGYAGYLSAGILNNSNELRLNKDSFFACGDNQMNSLDSRYWGPVPRKNLVGPAFLIYWPISSRWGVAH